MGVVAVALIGVGAVLAFVTPGYLVTRVFDDATVAQGVQRVLTDTYGLAVSSVTCPAGIVVVAGASFECTATVAGRPVRVPNRILGASGDYEVGRPSEAGL